MFWTLDLLGFLFLLSLAVDLFALCVVVGKFGGSVKWHWESCVIFALVAWAASFLLFHVFATALQNL